MDSSGPPAAGRGPAPGIKDVAALAQVSVGTVSNVLNRPAAVSAGTRARVERAIADLGFTRNESARQLRNGRSRTLAYVLLDARNPFFTDVAKGVEDVARGAGLALVLCNSDQDQAREDDYLDLLLEQRVRGVLVTPVSSAGGRLLALAPRGVPVVLVDRADHAGFDGCSVAVDDLVGGELAGGHLMELGHRRIAFAGGPLHLTQVADRLAGLRRAMAAAGRAAASDLAVLELTGLTVSEGRVAAQRLLGVSAPQRPSAVVCANDLVALGVLQELIQQGVRVPDEVAIVGYDDIEFASAATVPLTSVRQPRERLGRAAADMLLEEAEGDGRHVHRRQLFRPELVVRASTRHRQ